MKPRPFYFAAGAALFVAFAHLAALALSGCRFSTAQAVGEGTTEDDPGASSTSALDGVESAEEPTVAGGPDAQSSSGGDAGASSGADAGAGSVGSEGSIGADELGASEGDEAGASEGASTEEGSTTTGEHVSCIAECCTPHQGGGCGDPVLEACVCGFNDGTTSGAACCTLVWGEFCVEVATTVCGMDCEGCL